MGESPRGLDTVVLLGFELFVTEGAIADDKVQKPLFC
jgi:hypothetical protein